jgi:DNA-binding NarL/FixJ family response regulator
MKEKLRANVMVKSGQIEQLNLPPRQFYVFEKTMWGNAPSKIAKDLGVSLSAVSHTFRRILDKLN